MKICITCKCEKEFEKFGKNVRYLDGYRSECKECRNAKKRTGKPNTGRFKKGQISPRKGVKLSPERIEKMRLARINPNATTKGTGTYRYRCWREEVLKKSDRKCCYCGTKEKLHCHHIKPWKTHEDLRFEPLNGMALCEVCHRKEEMIGKTLPGLQTRFKKGHKLSKESIEKMKRTKRVNFEKSRSINELC